VCSSDLMLANYKNHPNQTCFHPNKTASNPGTRYLDGLIRNDFSPSASYKDCDAGDRELFAF